MAKNKAELQGILKALGEALGTPVNLDQTNDLLEEDISELDKRQAAMDLANSGEGNKDVKLPLVNGAGPELNKSEGLGTVNETEQEAELVVEIKALTTFETRTERGEKIFLSKGNTTFVTPTLADILIAEKVAVEVGE